LLGSLAERRGPIEFAGVLVVGRHLAKSLGRKVDGLPDALACGAPGEVPPIQDVHVPVDQVGRDRVRDSLLKRLVEGVSGGMRAIATL
jgi:hypothetical protein